MNLENDLKRALQRESPAPGFAERVLQRIGTSEGMSHAEPTRRPAWWRAAAASVTLAVVLGGYATHKAVEYRRGERAKEQVLVAMHLAGQKVRYAQQQVHNIGTQD
jgi:hypothetical protein